MLYFRNILNFPVFYRNRQDSVEYLKTNIINIKTNDDNLIIEGTTSKNQHKFLI